jgi:hypothetical protein
MVLTQARSKIASIAGMKASHTMANNSHLVLFMFLTLSWGCVLSYGGLKQQIWLLRKKTRLRDLQAYCVCQ